MVKSFKKKIASVVAVTMTAVMILGTGMLSKEVKAEDNLLTGEWTHVHEPYEANDVLIAATKVTANDEAGFTANISITGWQRNWYGVDEMPDDAWPHSDGWSDNPYQLRSYTMMNVTPKSTYRLSFDIANQMTSEVGNPTEKNVTVTVDSGIDGDTDNIFLFTTVRAAANGTIKFDKKFTIPESYKGDTVMVEIAYGSYAYSYAVSSSSLIKLMPADVIEKYVFAPGTTENVNAKGELKFTNMQTVQIPYEEPTTKPVVEKPTTNEQITTVTNEKVNGGCTCAAVKAKKKTGRPSVTAKNVKGRKIGIAWKKVKNASKYQIRVTSGKRVIKKTTTKIKYTIKGLSKKKVYKVSVRAYSKAGYGKWSKVKRIKVTK